jgi:hypothetical protein
LKANKQRKNKMTQQKMKQAIAKLAKIKECTEAEITKQLMNRDAWTWQLIEELAAK